MTEEEFIKEAVEINKKIGLTEEQSVALAELTVLIEKNRNSKTIALKNKT